MSLHSHLPLLATLTTALYTSSSQTERDHAYQILYNTFTNYTDAATTNAEHQEITEIRARNPGMTIRYAQQMLETKHTYTLIFAATMLRDAVSKSYALIEKDKISEIRHSIIRHLSRNIEQEMFIVEILLQTFYITYKATYWESHEAREIIAQMSNFSKPNGQYSLPHKIMSLHILNGLVQDMKKVSPSRIPGYFRRIAVDFRDFELVKVYVVGLDAMKESSDNESAALLSKSLLLMESCMNYDFIGLQADADDAEMETIHLPHAWQFITDIRTSPLERLIGYVPQSLPVLLQFASIRNSLFSANSDRVWYLNTFKRLIQDLLSRKYESDEWHVVWMLVARTRNLLDHLSDDLLRGIALTGASGLLNNEWSLNTTTYLLTFWSGIISSGKGSVDEGATIIARAFIQSRMKFDGDVDDADLQMSQLELFGVIGRKVYHELLEEIANLFEPTSSRMSDDQEYAQSQLVYIVGALLSGRSSQLRSETENIDAILSQKIFDLMMRHDILAFGDAKTESASLYFLSCFRHEYITDLGPRTQKIYEFLPALGGFTSAVEVIDFIVRKIIYNLSKWSGNTPIIKQSIGLLQDISIGYLSLKQLRSTPYVQRNLIQHLVEKQNFLDLSNNAAYRKDYYAILARVLCTEDLTPRLMSEFTAPWTAKLQEWKDAAAMETLRVAASSTEIQTLFRDMRGFVSSLQGKKAYNTFFEWMKVDYFPLVQQLAMTFANVPAASNSILKFIGEFVCNKGQRLNPEASGVTGILLFRHMSQVVSGYVSSLSSEIDQASKWTSRFKLYSQLFKIFRWSICGHYVNFAIFDLYGDQALNIMLDAFYQTLSTLPLQDLMAYPKLKSAYFDLIDSLLNELLSSIPKMTETMYDYIMYSLREGISDTHDGTVSQTCTALNHIATFLVEEIAKLSFEKHWLVIYYQQRPHVFDHLMMLILNIIIFENSGVEWSLSRALFILICLHPEAFHHYCNILVAYQFSQFQSILRSHLQDLLTGIHLTPQIANRDQFTTSLTHFKRRILQREITLQAPTAAMMRDLGSVGIDALSVEQAFAINQGMESLMGTLPNITI